MLYVALARATKKEYVNFCDIEILKPYTGHIYKYTYNNKHYIGSTTNLDKRKEEHKLNKTGKFGTAIQTIGYNNFKFEKIETIKFSDRQELFDLENHYIQFYDSVKNGYNSRYNNKRDL